jgi:PAS domain S-box-containing protein
MTDLTQRVAERMSGAQNDRAEHLDTNGRPPAATHRSRTSWPLGNGHMAERIRNHDWGATALGETGNWPPHLRDVVQLLLDSPEPTCLLWTVEGYHLYNDAYIAILNLRHPQALGRSFAQVWPESAHLDDARHGSVLRTGTPIVLHDRPYVISAAGVTRERFFTVSATPLRTRHDSVDGVVRRLVDTTELTEARRDLRYANLKLGEHQAGLTMQLALSDAISDESARRRAETKMALEDREERLSLALLAGRLATWDWDLETGRVIWSDRMSTLRGYCDDEIEQSFEAWAQRVHPDDLAGLLHALESALTGRGEFVHRFRLVHADQSLRWCLARGRYFYDKPGRAVRMLAVAQDVTEEYRADMKLRDVELRQRALIEGVPQLIWRADPNGQWLWSSPQWTRYTELSPQESLGDGWLDAVHPGDRERARGAWHAAVREGALDVEYRIGPIGSSQFRWFQTRATPIRNEEHDVIEWLGTSTDVDELRHARERQKLLVSELQHRTRNLIGVVAALTTLTSQDCDSLADFLQQFKERLRALSRAQGLLSRSEQEPISLAVLLKMEFDALGTDRIGEKVTLDGPEVRLQSSVVQTFALAVHELATNALKHGALLAPEGRVAVTWRLQSDAANQPRLRLDWHESGATAVVQPARKGGRMGSGRELLEQMLPYVLEAETHYEVTAQGVQCSIELPLRVSKATGELKVVAAQ